MHLQELHSLCLDDPLRNLPLWPYLAVAVTPRLMMSAISETDSHAPHGSVRRGSRSEWRQYLGALFQDQLHTHICTHVHLHTHALTHTCTDELLREVRHCALTQLCFKPVFYSICAIFLFDFCIRLGMKCNKDWYNSSATPMGIELEGNFISVLACTGILLRDDVNLPQRSGSFLH